MRNEILDEVLDLAETLNFTTTARRFFVTQSAVSRHVASLEEELGVELFRRSQHRVQLTEQGEALLPAIRSAARACQKLLADAQEIQGGYKDCITVGYLIAATRPFLAPASAMFERLFPTVKLKYLPMNPRQLEEALKNDEVDVAFTASCYCAPDPAMEQVGLYEDYYCMAVSKDHPFAKKRVLTRADLAGHTYVFSDKEFLPYERELLKAAFADIPHTLSDRRNWGLDDTAFNVADGSIAVPVLSHIRFYNEDIVKLVPLEEGIIDNATIMAVYKPESGHRKYLDKYLECVKTSARLVDSLPTLD